MRSPFDFVSIGHYSDAISGTGVTAVLFDNPLIGVLSYHGSATSTRQMDSLSFGHSVERIDGVCFTGGSAMGLGAGTGVQKFLIEEGRGLKIRGKAIVPIIPTAAIFDLFYKRDSFPGVEEGYIAAKNASREFETGSVGAGTGATVGKVLGYDHAMKGGFGAASIKVGDITIFSLVVVNNFGNVINRNGEIIAGVRNNGEFVKIEEIKIESIPFENTNLILVVTNADLNKEELFIAGRVASAAFGRFFSPPSSSVDGDILIMATRREKKILPDILGLKSIEVVGMAIENAIYSATGDGQILSFSDIGGR